MSLGGSVTTDSYKGRSVTLTWTAIQSVAENKSTISWELVGSGSASGWVTVSELYVIINGSQAYYRNSSNHTSCYSGTYLASGSMDIPHNSDGSKYFYIYVGAGIYNWTINCSDETGFTLNTIARASSISYAANVTLGNACSVQWTPASSSFRYKLNFTLGSFSSTTGYISPKTTSAYTYSGYTIPLSIADYIPNSTTATMTVYLYTYNGDTQIGSVASKTFTVTVPSNITPTLSTFSVSPDNSANSVISGWGLYVAGYSKAKLTAAGYGSSGSSISSFTVSGGYYRTVAGSSLSFTGDTLTSSGTKTFYAYATDSRGRSSSSKSASITVYAYSPPAISSFTASRSSSSSTSVSVSAAWTISSVNNKNSSSATLRYKKATTSSWTTYGSVTSGTTVTLSLSETDSYDFEVVVTDTVGNTARAIASVSTIAVLMDFRAGGKGLGIGKIAEKDALQVALESEFTENVKIYAKSSTDANSGLLQLYRGDKKLCAYLTTHDNGSGLRLHLYDANGNWKTYFRFTTDGQLIVPSLATDSITKASSTGTPFLAAFPIGSVYMSVDSTSPASFIGGTWARITNTFLLAAGYSGNTLAGYSTAPGSTGGEATHTLSISEMPNHNHGQHVIPGDADVYYYASGKSYGDRYYNTDYVGGGQAHNNMPPFLAVYVWKRTA